MSYSNLSDRKMNNALNVYSSIHTAQSINLPEITLIILQNEYTSIRVMDNPANIYK